MEDKGFIRGTMSDTLIKLMKDEVEPEFPIERYEKLSPIIKINNTLIAVFVGAEFHFNEYFEVDIETMRNSLELYPPGVLFLLNSASQVTARGYIEEPKPRDLGLAMITAKWRKKVPVFCVKWPLIPSTTVRNIHGFKFTMWKSLSKVPKHLFRLNDIDKIYEKRKRMKLPRIEEAFPEPKDTVDRRLRDKSHAHEPSYARCVELTNSWRIVIPNTSQEILSLPVPYISSKVSKCINRDIHIVIGDNFNIITSHNRALSIVLAALFNLLPVREYLRYISPWSKGDTPRPRVRHVLATIDEFLNIIKEAYSKSKAEAETIATSLSIVWYLMLLILHCFIRPSLYPNAVKVKNLLIKPLRSNIKRYKNIQIQDNTLTIIGDNNKEVKLEFNSPYTALLGFLAVWNAIGLKMPLNEAIDEFLIPQSIMSMEKECLAALENIIIGRLFNKLIRKIEEELM